MTTRTDTTRRFLVRRDDFRATRIRERPAPDAIDDAPQAGLDAGSARLSVDHFALTANNVTYAAYGDAMSYWDFFPTGEDGWGCIPVWGFGTVFASRCDGVAVGERFYGYFPMASDVVVVPSRVRAGGFVDAAAHRQPLHRLYNQYVRNSDDPMYDARREPLQMLYRPLFITSFAIDDWLLDGHLDGARAVLISSASSKTAYGLAWQLSRRRPDGPEVIGLTSARNRAFVEGLRCYDRVVTYDAYDAIDASLPVAYVDFAGDRALRAALHRHFDERMRVSLAVGASHVDASTPDEADRRLPGAKTTSFFAPAQIAKRSEEWGAAGFQQRFAAAWDAFVARVDAPDRPWIRVVDTRGAAAVESVYRALLDGRAAPDEGHIVSLAG